MQNLPFVEWKCDVINILINYRLFILIIEKFTRKIYIYPSELNYII